MTSVEIKKSYKLVRRKRFSFVFVNSEMLFWFRFVHVLHHQTTFMRKTLNDIVQSIVQCLMALLPLMILCYLMKRFRNFEALFSTSSMYQCLNIQFYLARGSSLFYSNGFPSLPNMLTLLHILVC